MISHSNQSGALYVNSNELDGMLFFEAGQIAHAECGDLIGDDAVITIVQRCNGVETGDYKFVPGATAVTRTVLRSPTQLMLEALRVLDENNTEGEVV